MKRSSFLASTAFGAVLGATLFGATPAFSQMPVIDFTSIAIERLMNAVQNTISNTLSSISSSIGGTTYGDTNTLLREGFTQNANYAKGQISAQQQITDASNTAMARFFRDMRNASIRDQHTVNPLHCAHVDNGQTVIAGGAQSWKVSTAIQTVQDQRGEAGKGMPAYYGTGQAIESLNELHYKRYCSQDEASAGLCQVSQNQNADQRALTLFGTGTLDGQNGVNAANDYVTDLVQPIVPAALRGDQLTSIIGKEATAKRREYEARMSLARNVLDDAIAVQSPSVPLNTLQQQQLQNEGISPAITTGSTLTALALDVHRRYSDINWEAQLQSMPAAGVEREIANELAVTNYLLLETYRIAMKHASVAATQLAATEEQTFRPAVELPTPNVANQ